VAHDEAAQLERRSDPAAFVKSSGPSNFRLRRQTKPPGPTRGAGACWYDGSRTAKQFNTTPIMLHGPVAKHFLTIQLPSLAAGSARRSSDWAEVQESWGSGGEARGGRGLGDMTLRRFSVTSFFANRLLGEFSCLHSSASRASLVHVRAMSSRMSRTRALGARSANCWQSYDRFLNIAGVSTGSPRRRSAVRHIGSQNGARAIQHKNSPTTQTSVIVGDGKVSTSRTEAEGALRTVKVCESGGTVGGPAVAPAVPAPR
jgi:hypothetical protein